jgi:hypothetical protein
MKAIPDRGKGFFYSTASRPALGPTLASYPMGTSGSLLGGGGVKGRDVKLTTHLHLVPRSRIMELIKHRDNFTLYM